MLTINFKEMNFTGKNLQLIDPSWSYLSTSLNNISALGELWVYRPKFTWFITFLELCICDEEGSALLLSVHLAAVDISGNKEAASNGNIETLMDWYPQMPRTMIICAECLITVFSLVLDTWCLVVNKRRNFIMRDFINGQRDSL